MTGFAGKSSPSLPNTSFTVLLTWCNPLVAEGMIDYRVYPRITGSLRAHSNIAERLHYRGDDDELHRRRQQSTEIESKKTLSWNDMQQILLQHSTNPANTEQQAKQLRKYALEFGQ